MPATAKHKPKSARQVAIAVELARRGWSQSDLAAAIDRARNTVNRAINHGENPRTLRLILAKLQIR